MTLADKGNHSEASQSATDLRQLRDRGQVEIKGPIRSVPEKLMATPPQIMSSLASEALLCHEVNPTYSSGLS